MWAGRYGVRIPARTKIRLGSKLPLTKARNDPAHSSSGNSFPGTKQSKLEANHTRAFSTMVENEWSCTPSLPTGLRLDSAHKYSVTNVARSPSVSRVGTQCDLLYKCK